MILKREMMHFLTAPGSGYWLPPSVQTMKTILRWFRSRQKQDTLQAMGILFTWVPYPHSAFPIWLRTGNIGCFKQKGIACCRCLKELMSSVPIYPNGG